LYKKKKYLAVILARGGSKRLPKKNLINLDNKPLIAHTILSGMRCQYLDETIVSSDDKKILDVSKKYGAKIIKRPKYLASDRANSVDALRHVVKNASSFDYLVLLQPTSPLRNEKHISEAIHLIEKKKADAIISVCKVEQNRPGSNFLPKNLSMRNFFKKKFLKKESQILKDCYILNGAIHICKISPFLKEKSLFLKNKIYAYLMSKKDSVDIDTEADIKLARQLIKKNSIEKK